MTDDPPVFFVYRRLHFPSGRTVRKYVRVGSANSMWTENLAFVWLTPDRARAEEVARQCDGIVEERAADGRQGRVKWKVKPRG